MPQLIKQGQIITDDWTFVGDDEADNLPESEKLILPFRKWTEHSETTGSNNAGVWITGDTDLSEISTLVNRAPLIAILFPTFMDGRGFTTGRLLRERYGFTNELRAIGHFIRDQLCYLRRCGFDAFQFEGEHNLAEALQSLTDFQEYYQAGVDQPLPLFRRRNA